MGGFLKGIPWKDDPQDKTTHSHALLWGEVIREPKVNLKLKRRYVEVLVKYQSKTFLICKRWSAVKSDFGKESVDPINKAIENLRKHDTVLIMGRYDVSEYVNRDGVQKKAYNMRVEFVVPMDVVALLSELLWSPSLQQLLQLDEKYADKMEVVRDIDEPDDYEDYEDGGLEDYGEYSDIGF